MLNCIKWLARKLTMKITVPVSWLPIQMQHYWKNCHTSKSRKDANRFASIFCEISRDLTSLSNKFLPLIVPFQEMYPMTDCYAHNIFTADPCRFVPDKNWCLLNVTSIFELLKLVNVRPYYFSNHQRVKITKGNGKNLNWSYIGWRLEDIQTTLWNCSRTRLHIILHLNTTRPS